MSAKKQTRRPSANRRVKAANRSSGTSQNTIWIVAVVVIVVIGALLIALARGGSKSTSVSVKIPTGSAKAAIIKDATSIPPSVFDAVGGGTASAAQVKTATKSIPEVDGKPQYVYIGAEYCPYCAAQRWAIAAALERFGSLSKVGLTHSSSSDVYANTRTLTFHGTAYSSKYLVFTPAEIWDNQLGSNGRYGKLDTLTADRQALFAAESPSQGVPFEAFGGKYVILGPTYDPSVLQGLSWAQIVKEMHDPNSAVAQGAIGSANLISAAICATSGGQPGDVCNSAGVTAAAKMLPS